MYRSIKKISLGLALLASSLVSAQNINLPIVDLAGGRYFYYEVESGDSAYGIAKKFGWDYDELCRLNPQVIKNLKKGAMLYYPTGEKADTAVQNKADGEVITHVIRKGETVYSLAGKYNVPIEQIYADNPNSRDGIQEGKTLIINRTNRISNDASKVNADENVIAQTSEENVKPDEENKVSSVSQEKNEEYIPVIPVSEDKDETKISPSDINKERTSNIVVLLDDPDQQRDREFMRGFLLALKEMGNSWQKVNLTVIDARKGEAKVTEEISGLSPDLILLTDDKDIPEWIVDYGNKNNFPVINVFDVKYSRTDSNPSMVQLLTPSKEFNTLVSDYIVKTLGDYRLVFADAIADNDGIAENLKNNWDKTNYLELPMSKIMEKALREDGKYLFYINATKAEEVQKQLEDIMKMKERSPLANVKVIGRPNWVTFPESMSELFASTDVYVPSRFYVDWNSLKVENFVKKYEEIFNRAPQKSFPVYALSGYDVAEIFIPSLAANGGDFSRGMLRGDTIQSDIILEKPEENGGWLNKAVYLVRFTPFNTIEKLLAE